MSDDRNLHNEVENTEKEYEKSNLIYNGTITIRLSIYKKKLEWDREL